MLTNFKTKKNNRKKAKIQNFEKQKSGLEILGRGTFPPNSASICLTGSETAGFTDGRTIDNGRPSDDSSSAVQ